MSDFSGFTQFSAAYLQMALQKDGDGLAVSTHASVDWNQGTHFCGALAPHVAV